MINILDLFGASFSLIAAYLYVKENPWAWPIAAFAMPVDLYLYACKGLYADMVLQLSYLLSTLYGWYYWCRGGKKNTRILVSYITHRHALSLSVGVVVIFFSVLKIVASYTTFYIACLDSLAAVLSIVAQWLMCRKIIETWVVWLLVDAIYIYLYVLKEVPVHAFMTAIYFMMALAGYFRWRREWRVVPTYQSTV